MRFIKYLFLLICSAAAFPAISQKLNTNNPLLIHSNNPIPFDKVDAKMIREATTQVVQLSDSRIKNMISGAKPGTGPGNTMKAFDDLQYEITDLDAKLQMISSTYVLDSIRNAALEGDQLLTDYQTALTLNEPLYKVVKAYADQSLHTLKPNQQKWIKEQVQYFENNGMKLDSTNRKQLQVIKDKMTAIGLQFDRNIATSKDSIVFTETEMTGVPEKTKLKWKRPNGDYLVYINNNAYDIMKFADSETTRRKLGYKFNNRAFPVNMKVLDSLLYYRQVYAQKLGYTSYAAYAVATKMAGTPEAVWAFENNLVDKLAPRVTKDIAEIRALKHQMHPELPDAVFVWDIGYYRNILLNTKYKLNTEQLKEYFEMNNTIQGMFEVYHRLLGITVKETTGWPVWYNKVKSYEMFVGSKKVGNFYFDLYPRDNKYNHFACFPMSQPNQNGGNEILPLAALICNFPEGAKGEPTLLSQGDLETLFHEFGHLVAAMVVRTDIASQAWSFKGDFAEAPSQFLENFTWQKESLKVFAKNYKTGAVLPDSLFDKLKSTEHVLDGYAYTQQIYFGMIDFTFEDKYDSIRGKDLGDVEKNLYRIMQLPYPDGTHQITSFNHLSGYGANYYGYLWSLVFAQDIFSVFLKNGVMDPATGERYRKDILEQAGSVEEKDMLRKFLGREANSDAFMKSIGL